MYMWKMHVYAENRAKQTTRWYNYPNHHHLGIFFLSCRTLSGHFDLSYEKICHTLRLLTSLFSWLFRAAVQEVGRPIFFVFDRLFILHLINDMIVSSLDDSLLLKMLDNFLFFYLWNQDFDPFSKILLICRI